MSIDKYDVLRYAETLTEEDLQLLREQLTLIQNVKYPVVLSGTVKVDTDLIKKKVRNIPPYKPEPLRSVSDGEPRPPFVPPPPPIVWKDCKCSSWWKVVHPKDCKCGGGRFVPEDEL